MGCSSSKNSVQEFTAPKGGGGPTEAEGTAASTPTKEPAAAKDAAASSLPWAGLDVATPGPKSAAGSTARLGDDLDGYLALIEQQEESDSPEWDLGATPARPSPVPAQGSSQSDDEDAWPSRPHSRADSGHAPTVYDAAPRALQFCTATDVGGRSENQDVAFVLELGAGGWCGAVLDGHGGDGKDAAFFASKRMHTFLEKSSDTRSDPPKARHCRHRTLRATAARTV